MFRVDTTMANVLMIQTDFLALLPNAGAIGVYPTPQGCSSV